MQDTPLTSTWRSPSNIAIIKYWGKHGNQLPANPSLSITLSEACTETRIVAQKKDGTEPTQITFRFHGEENPEFAKRIRSYVDQLSVHAPFLKTYHLIIESENSFPHSSGIASSASAMSALALCLSELQSILTHKPLDDAFHRHVSLMARIGSGSASRSIYGPVASWGRSDMIPDSSDEYAIPLKQVHAVFQTLRDTILIIDEGQKAVSSSQGHALMHGHPFAQARISQVQQHLKMLLPALHSGDMITFGRIAESEAMTLHALMMTSDPPFILMQPDTLRVLEAIKAFRDSSGIPVFFTLDAGPNVHVLYPAEHEAAVRAWIVAELSPYCKDGRMIHDYAGTGPIHISDPSTSSGQRFGSRISD